MSDTSDTSVSRSGSSTNSFRMNRPKAAKTKFERDIDAAINRGVSNCHNAMHWHTVVVPGGDGKHKWTDVEIKRPRDILKLMAPGPAKCLCERNACQWAWTGNWNHKGMFSTQWVLEGVEQKGIPTTKEKDKEQARYAAKQVWPMHHSVSEAAMKILIHRFPEWHFISVNSASHDHPVAHYSTKIASERLMNKLPRGTADKPKVYIDLNGNPAANAAFMRRNPGITIVTLVECITPKDFINRATKWGPQVDEYGNTMWHDDVHVRDVPRELAAYKDVISGFVSIHTAYYYDPHEIAALLEWSPGSVFYASMHRFDGMEGTINNAEQKWEKRPTPFGQLVNQRNEKTGECYEHPDNAWWYEHDSRTCGDKSFGWTMGELCEETYFFMATSVPVVQARMSSKCYENKMPEEPISTGKAQSKQAMLAAKQVEVMLYGATLVAPIAPCHVDLFDKVRTSLIGKSRGPKQYEDHISRCKVAASGMMADKGVAIQAQQLSDLARLSFMIDFEDNYSHDSAMFSTSYVRRVQADHLYKQGNGLVSMGTLSLLSDMCMEAVDSKDLKMAGLKAIKCGVSALHRKGVLNAVK